MIPAVRVHGPDEAAAAVRAAADAGTAVLLLSAPAAAAHGGAGWFLAMAATAAAAAPRAVAGIAVDCADRTGDAQAVLAEAATAPLLRAVIVTGHPAAVQALDALARTRGAAAWTAPPGDVLDLNGVPDPYRACRAWLETRQNRATISAT
ncbi:hypothetical protein M2352_001626 [Azospirillum fermentarium]|uniref:hypothetical protein n=1 Tax=Azospirillum fermentarium TaxID=1233114 RepID=UPI002225DA95|nr:hypothetical protein [Azospirillum fermentarium]MCW2246035.1 hypothetical protein [Azospirillum fermentarium]